MSAVDEAWQIVAGDKAVDAETLFDVLSRPSLFNDPDPRTALLLRDAVQSLQSFWGSDSFECRIGRLPHRDQLQNLAGSDSSEIGFPSLQARVMNITRPETVLQMFRELGLSVQTPESLIVGGSMALMFDGLIERHTEDVDVVDELPPAMRNEHALLQTPADRYGLKLAHFQSHYLPEDWALRTKPLGIFGQLSVRLVDPIDVLTGKLFSRRVKDLDDVRHAWPKLDQPQFRARITQSTSRFRRDAGLNEIAARNWYIITGEQNLPAANPA